MTDWDWTFDLVVVGSGAAGLTAAVTARHRGLSVVVLEKTAYFGGSTALSGGGLWIPNNALMQRAGVHDSFEAALTYLQATVGDQTPRVKQEAYLREAPRMLDFLIAQGLRFRRVEGYSDYYPEKPGGHVRSRLVESARISGRPLGKLYPLIRSREGLAGSLALTTSEYRALGLSLRTPGNFLRIAGVMLRNAWQLLTKRRDMALGKALVGQLILLADRLGVVLWNESPIHELVLDGQRVRGVIATHEGRTVRIQARRGVVLAAGGFAHNAQMRQRYQQAPIETSWTSAAPGDTGEVIEAAQAIGADLALMDDAWWGPTSLPDGIPMFHVNERSLPGSIIVDQAGRRFMNEAQSYTDAVHIMYAHHREVPCIPAYFIMDARFRRLYPFGMVVPGLTPRKLLRDGYFIQAPTLEGLARKLGIDAEGLQETVRRFNEFAQNGHDLDFHRGENAYDRYYGDPTVKPNPCLAPLRESPFYAVKLWPGDLGTKGGLVTDERARVLRADGSPIEGLYAAGNTTASVMGHFYPGPGATIGPAMTFGYIAALDLATAPPGAQPAAQTQSAALATPATDRDGKAPAEQERH